MGAGLDKSSGCVRPRSMCVRGAPITSSSSSYVPVANESDGDKEEDERPEGMSEEHYLAHVGSAKAVSILRKREAGCIGVESGSVYGAAVVMPQVARSAGWSVYLSAMALQAYGWLFFNIIMQTYFLYLISTEQAIMNKFAGQMHLCDFGASLPRCPGAPDCFGPAGTEYTPSRLYSFDLWSTRTFVRDSMVMLFPDRKDEILRNVDPGEFGLESYSCRVACIFIFILALWGDLSGTLEMVQLLYHVPNENEYWVTYGVPDWAPSKAHIKAVKGWTELELVSFRVRGMSVGWKFVNVFFVIAPKIWLWLVMIHVGVTFLMETAAIVDLIINAVALNFVLGLDEMIFSILLPAATSHILDNLEEFETFDIADEEDDTMREAFDKHCVNRKWKWTDYHFWDQIISRKIVFVLIITVGAIMDYYYSHCTYDGRLGWIAKELHLPDSVIMSLNSFLAPYFFPEKTTDGIAWEMPDVLD